MDQETKDLIVELYTATDDNGKQKYTLEQITTMTGVGRSSIYYTLEQQGVTKNRSSRYGDSALAEILRECQNENATLKARVDQLNEQLERANKLLDKLVTD